MNWCEVNPLLDWSNSGLHHDSHAPCYRAYVRAYQHRKYVRLGFYFVDLIFVDHQSTAKTVKIGSLENFRPYGISHIIPWL